jgi:hypothetical protein
MQLVNLCITLSLAFFLLPTVSLGQQAKSDIGQAIDDQADHLCG